MQDINVTIIQSGLHWEKPDENLAMFTRKIYRAGETDLIILPEMFNTGFTMNNKAFAERMDGKTVQWMTNMTKEKNCVITGSLIVEEGGKYFNRLIWMRADGSFECYDKKHLFRYAKEHDFYSPGSKKLIVDLKGWNICPMVCYDLRFPVWIRNKYTTSDGRYLHEYDVLIVVANWPERRSDPWKTLLQARAIENQCYVVGANRVGNDGNGVYHSGDSAVVDPRGKIVSVIKPHEELTETVTLSRKELEDWRKTFPAWMDSDDFEVR